jgi:hypothetical protein
MQVDSEFVYRRLVTNGWLNQGDGCIEPGRI